MNSVFDNYVKSFDLNDKDIKLKYNHSYRVADLSKKTPKDLRKLFPSPCIKFVIWKNLIDRQITLGDYLLENGISLDSIQK